MYRYSIWYKYLRAVAEGLPPVGLAPGVAVADGPCGQAGVLVAGVVPVALEPRQALTLEPEIRDSWGGEGERHYTV